MFRKHQNPMAEKVGEHTQNSSRFPNCPKILVSRGNSPFLLTGGMEKAVWPPGCMWLLVVHISLAACCHLPTEPDSSPRCALRRTQNLQRELGKEKI